MSIVQISLIGILGALLALQLKQYKAEYAVYLCIAVSLIIIFSIISHLETIINTLKMIRTYIDFDAAYMGALMKMLGVTYVSEFASAICKDAGQQTIAVQIEIFSKITILVLSLPIMLALLKTIQNFLS